MKFSGSLYVCTIYKQRKVYSSSDCRDIRSSWGRGIWWVVVYIWLSWNWINHFKIKRVISSPKVKPLAMMIGMRAIVFMRELCNVDATFRAKIVTALRSRVRVAVIVLLNQFLFFNDGTLLVNNWVWYIHCSDDGAHFLIWTMLFLLLLKCCCWEI